MVVLGMRGGRRGRRRQKNLVILFDFAFKKRGDIELTSPWKLASIALKSLGSKLGDSPSDTLKAAASEAAFAVVDLVISSYVEFMKELLGGFEALSESEKRTAALWSLRECTKGHREVAKLMNRRMQLCANGGVLVEKKLDDGQKWIVSHPRMVNDVLRGNVEGLRENLDKDVQIFLAVDEVQALDGLCKNLFLRKSVTLGQKQKRRAKEAPDDVMYALGVELAGFIISELNLRSVFIGTHTTFSGLRTAKSTSPIHLDLHEVHSVDMLNLAAIKKLVLYYFNVEIQWDSLMNQDRYFKECVTLLQCRGRWAAEFLMGIDGLLRRGEAVVDALRISVMITVETQERRLRDTIRAALSSLEEIVYEENRRISGCEAMMTVYLMIALDIPSQHVEKITMYQLIVDNAVLVRDQVSQILHRQEGKEEHGEEEEEHRENEEEEEESEQEEDGKGEKMKTETFAMVSEEPMVRDLVLEETRALLDDPEEGSWPRDTMDSLINGRVGHNFLLNHGSLGEVFEPYLCHKMLHHRPYQDGSISLWSLFEPYLSYIKRHIEGSDPDLRVQTTKVRKDLESVKCHIRACRNLQNRKSGGSNGDEMKHAFFRTFPPRKRRDYCLDLLFYQLSNNAGFDIVLLAIRGDRWYQQVVSVGILSKLSDTCTFEGAATTTDPKLQYLNRKRRETILVNEKQSIVASENSMVRKYWAWRDVLGKNDRLSYCHRFVASFNFDENTEKVALRKYFDTNCPLLPLDVSSEPAYKRKMELRKDAMDDPTKRMEHMDGSTPLWIGAKRPKMEFPTKKVPKAASGSGEAQP